MIPSLPSTGPARFSARIGAGLVAGLMLGFAAVPAAAMPSSGAYLVFDARTGEVIARHNADQAWYPASVTKLMTAWVTLQAIRAGRITPTTLVPMTAAAARQPPSKMGFKVGEPVTVDNALKIIMVKSANDVSYALAEAVGGSKEAFVAEMNRQAKLLGMSQTRWNNPHGLPDASQVSTARDLGLLARALLHEFPEADELWHLPGIRIGDEVIRNHNHLIDHFPGADGMKTGFICSAGFNVVASASRGNRRLIAVVLGARNTRQRAEIAAELFTKGFESGGSFFGRFAVADTLDKMPRGPEFGSAPRDVKQEICGPKRKNEPDPEEIAEPAPGVRDDPGALVRPGSYAAQPQRTSYLAQRFEVGPPVRVWVGGPEAAPADAGGLLALLPGADTVRAPIFTAPPSLAPPSIASTLPPAKGAIRPGAKTAAIDGGTVARSMPLPPTAPPPGAGLAATLPPADGRPLGLGVPVPPRPTATTTPPPKKIATSLPPDKPKPGKAAKPASTQKKPVKKPVGEPPHPLRPPSEP